MIFRIPLKKYVNVTVNSSYCFFGSGKTMKSPASNSRPKRGRPKIAKNLSRPHRIVTFVTDRERELLNRVANEEDRSMAAVVHRIIKAHFDQ